MEILFWGMAAFCENALGMLQSVQFRGGKLCFVKINIGGEKYNKHI